MMKVSLRKSRPSDLDILNHWDEQPHVIDSDPDDDRQWETELLRDPEWREMLMAERIGFVFQEKSQFNGEDCLVYAITRERWQSF